MAIVLEHLKTGGEMALMPLDKVAGFDVRPGLYRINGATAIPCGVSFTVHSCEATSCELLLFKYHEKEPYAVIPFPKSYRIGNVWSMIVFGLEIDEFEYAYRLDGPYVPEKGLIFNKDKMLLDPYAKVVSGQKEWGKRPAREDCYRARVVRDNYDWGGHTFQKKAMEDLIIYEMHIRGFSYDKSSGVTHPGTFAGLAEKIPYLKELGINAVELMPIFEFDEMGTSREFEGKQLLDYWGYNPVCFFAPNTGYESRPERNHEGMELKKLIHELHDNGIEVILDVVFNHTAEGNEDGRTFSFKGFDNQVYYLLTPDGQYYNFSGCGNTLNCNHPVVQQMIVECLRHWVVEYRVDGFRFDLASILGRNEDGSPMSKPPLLQSLAFDPLLKDTKLIAEAWDAGGLYQVGSFPSWDRWAEWNGKYRDDLRSFLKGDGGFAQVAVRRIAGSYDIYDMERRSDNPSVNFLTCHDGFPLYDLYSYNVKHNEANGWNNTDGADDNRSWNCGVEGETDDPEVLRLRYRMIRNACAVLMCSRGTPMFLAGDEFCNTQFGNNNPYCQDNEISWLDWSRRETYDDIFQFFKYMIAFRKEHPAIRKQLKPSMYGLPDMSFHSEQPYADDYNWDSRVVGVMFAGRTDEGKEDIVYIAINAFWEPRWVTLPKLPVGYYWKMAVNTYEESFYPSGQDFPYEGLETGPRSVAVFYAEPIQNT